MQLLDKIHTVFTAALSASQVCAVFLRLQHVELRNISWTIARQICTAVCVMHFPVSV